MSHQVEHTQPRIISVQSPASILYERPLFLTFWNVIDSVLCAGSAPLRPLGRGTHELTHPALSLEAQVVRQCATSSFNDLEIPFEVRLLDYLEDQLPRMPVFLQ